ncbi:MAG: PfkB family carbohydrate kinase [Treponemataceae bacterium]
MKKIITMGEIMARLSPKGFLRFNQADGYDLVYGGGEANVAVSLANYGHDVAFLTKLPTHEIGEAAVQFIRKMGVETKYIARGGERVGIYYIENGVSMRASKVVYDRSHSSISQADIKDFDFDAIFKGKDWFHFTGITPALGEKATLLTTEAVKKAKENGLTVSVDLNYRKKLWTPEQAQKAMIPLMDYVDVCIGNEEDAEKVLGLKPKNSDIHKGSLSLDGYKDLLKTLAQTYNFTHATCSLRESFSASNNGWSGLAYDTKDFFSSKHYDIHIVDRVGAGDSYAAGFIHGLISQKGASYAVEFAAAASALKHTIFGDFNLVTADEVEALMGGDGSGRVQR